MTLLVATAPLPIIASILFQSFIVQHIFKLPKLGYCSYRSIMKTFLVLVVAFLLVLATLQAESKRLTLEEKQKLMMAAARQLLSETNTGAAIN
ncbi:hypothetical protein Patl1_24857 [Pistacia atlantica]|uniref:Uncharacterized protein n=1 Tax=Pistacia atlantica TaxID=434234 RepID=A0ACC1B4H6_9ROSI|nr:hypothetical protein Patl1_24857 [Pistacia atlantica]